MCNTTSSNPKESWKPPPPLLQKRKDKAVGETERLISQTWVIDCMIEASIHRRRPA
jgi:hypothetical protein